MFHLKASNPLRNERDGLLGKLDGLDRALNLGSLDGAMESLCRFEEQMALHHRMEREVLLPALLRHLTTRQQPFSVMEEACRQEENRLKELREALRASRRGESSYHGRLYVELLRAHLCWMDKTLLPLAERSLSPKEWETVRKGFEAISSDHIPGAKGPPSPPREFLVTP